ncbi:basic amino acid ABC transporter substrate-binding protein [Aeribacillus pallidus]|uniref:basic amino acid ABC transporter substrate-binding protein n=1 Tax=Aeribacillus pallidus TaxID=33936 RepID=UPI003D24696E
MKKGVLLGIIMMMVFALIGCGQASSDQASGGDVQKVVVATDAAFAPFEYMEKGEIVGFDIDFLDAVMAEAGLEYDLKNIGWDPLFAAVQGKEVDMAISGITINDKRKQTYDFSVPYFQSTHMILVPEGSDIKNANDLIGKKVGVQNGTTGQAAVEKLLGEENENIKKFENNVVAIMELLNGGVDAVVTDNTVVNEYLKNNPDKNLVGIEDPTNFESEFYGLMFPKGSELKEKLDAGIKTVIENGTYAEIYKEWFGSEPNVDVLLEQQ